MLRLWTFWGLFKDQGSRFKVQVAAVVNAASAHFSLVIQRSRFNVQVLIIAREHLKVYHVDHEFNTPD
jgi:hypothetical protein